MKNYIITINDNYNYGNRLQNYALSFLLSSVGECKTCQLLLESNHSLMQRLSLTNSRILPLVKKILRRNSIQETNRELNFMKFNVAYLRQTSLIDTTKSGSFIRLDKPGTRFVIGSDQVWNYKWITQHDMKVRLGMFVTPHRLLTYAASIGVDNITDDWVFLFREGLSRISSISVREYRAAELVKELTGLDAAVVLDPTLMLDTNQWNGITRGFVREDDRYVLTYFLGHPSDRQEQTIRRYAQTHGCRIRRIIDMRDRETYVAGPQDFVELFSKAQYVFTDSYHACCFSILYHKQFTVFNRAGAEGAASMNSRMETLFRLFDLDSVVMDDGLAPNIDYGKVDKFLAQHRSESQTWLNNAMKA